jgi:hypothetical protein
MEFKEITCRLSFFFEAGQIWTVLSDIVYEQVCKFLLFRFSYKNIKESYYLNLVFDILILYWEGAHEMKKFLFRTV